MPKSGKKKPDVYFVITVGVWAVPSMGATALCSAIHLVRGSMTQNISASYARNTLRIKNKTVSLKTWSGQNSLSTQTILRSDRRVKARQTYKF